MQGVECAQVCGLHEQLGEEGGVLLVVEVDDVLQGLRQPVLDPLHLLKVAQTWAI